MRMPWWHRRRRGTSTITISGLGGAITPQDKRDVRKQVDIAPGLATIEEREREEALAGQQGDRRLKKLYGLAILIGVGLQLLIADLMFLGYAEWGVRWKVDPWVMSVWLTATVVEVLGVVAIVTTGLFSTKK